ncbi:MAG: bifunctional adenosylcobinamide kinase/adenosylcobinamide-phosphate guanylyltransferase [Clostridia bacterium]|nr:bifunctional adenosylcobinamide kinase/adenosylcobinamide-phosphate guanylyltransferase [Clostridia bacterium]
MNIFICGGCKNGKSSLAQELAVKLAQGEKHYYVATMIAGDEEDHLRIKRHVKDREGMGFETLEIGRGIAACLTEDAAESTFLIDSVTALLANEMFHDNITDAGALERCTKGLLQVLEHSENCVIVSDYLFADAVRFDALTEQYRCALAALHRTLANVCDTVAELCADTVVIHKGELPQ